MINGTLTLADYAKLSNRPTYQKYVKSIYKTANFMGYLRFAERADMTFTAARLTNASLGAVSLRDLNEDPGNFNSDTDSASERAILFRDNIRMDRRLKKMQSMVRDPLKVRFDAYAESLQFTFNQLLLNGDPSASAARAKELIGLRTRLRNPATYKVKARNFINAGGVDLSPGGATAGTGALLCQRIDELLTNLGKPEGDDVIITMDGELKRNWQRVTRTGQFFNQSKDQYDRVLTKYRNATIVEAGMQLDDATRILPLTDTATGAAGAGDFTSIVAFDASEGALNGWKDGDAEYEDCGMSDNGVFHNYLFDLTVGIFPNTDYCFGEIYNIKAK